MAKAKKKKAGMTMLAWIMLAVMAVGLVLSVVGIFTDWITTKGEVLGGLFSGDSSQTLQDLFESQSDFRELDEDYSIKYFDITYTCAWITLIAVAAAFGCFLVGGLLKMKLLKTIGMIAGILAIVAGIMAAVFTALMGKEMSADAGIASATTSLAVGCYLTLVGGIVGGAGAIISGVNK